MAGVVRKRSWVNGKGEQKSAWVAKYPDQTGKWRLKTFATRKAADAWLTDARYEVKGGIHTPEHKSLTVAEAAQLWIRRGELAELERGSLRQYRMSVNLHIVPFLGAVRLARLTTPVIVEFRDQLLEKFSRMTARTALSHLRSILGEMQRRGLIAQNNANPVRVEIRSRERRKLIVGRDVPSKAEVQRLLAAAHGWWRILLTTAVFTGMRASELRGLTWDDVDFERKRVDIRQRADQFRMIGQPKSAAGTRSIPLAEPALNVLREWRREWQLAGRKGDGLVFRGAQGDVLSPTPFVNRWSAAQREGGIVDAAGEPKYSFHKLRHFFASWAIEQGFSPKRLQEMLGHSSVKMTFDTYGHLFPDDEDDQARLTAGARAILNAT
jgi:integrase